MTLTSPLNSVRYQANGITRSFDFRILIPLGALQVYHTQGDVETLVSPALYSVSGLGKPDGGTVTFLTAPVSGVITLARRVPLTQEMDLMNGAVFHAEAIEAAFDKVTMGLQQLDDGLSRAVQVPNGSGIQPGEYLKIIREAAAEAKTAAAGAKGSETKASGSAVLAEDARKEARAEAGRAGHSAQVAEQKATEAGHSARNAEASAQKAQASAEQSAKSATQAASSAQKAETSAQESLSSARAAADSETAARKSAVQSADSAAGADRARTEAKDAASNAANAAKNADSSVRIAEQKASEAQKSAEQSVKSAEAAKASETAAKTEAAGAAASAEDAETAARAVAGLIARVEIGTTTFSEFYRQVPGNAGSKKIHLGSLSIPAPFASERVPAHRILLRQGKSSFSMGVL